MTSTTTTSAYEAASSSEHTSYDDRRGNWTPVSIGLMVVGFAIFWPIGLALLAWNIWGHPWSWDPSANHHWGPRGKSKFGCGRSYRKMRRSSGNMAFDDYRDETMRRLHEEHQEFMNFMEELKRAKDKEEFDAFMTARERSKSAPDQS